MKKILLLFVVAIITTTTIKAQVFDSLGVVSLGNEVRDLAVKGSTLYAAVGQGGVLYSNDEGFTWTACSPLPDNGFGTESAYSILVASNGDLIIGGNQVYNNAPLGGACFRSSDDGVSWTAVVIEGYAGYEQSGKIVELSDGSLMMRGGFQKLFVSSLSDLAWTQTTAPGGVIFGFEEINDEIFVVNNPAGGTAGTWTTTDLGATWQRYGSYGTPVGSGTVTIAPIIQSDNYKFIGIGGTYEPRGMYRSGIGDTLWVQKNNGIGESGIYPICMATDHLTNWMIIQNQAGTCMFTETADYGDNWETAIPGLPNSGGSAPCPEKMVVFGSHLYTYSQESIFRKEDVAVPVSVEENLMDANTVSIFPNPVVSDLQIVFDKDIDKGTWTIVDLHGQQLSSGGFSAVSNSKLTIDSYEIEPGFYLLNIQVGQDKQSFKFFKK